MPVTVRSIIDQARLRHWAFTEVELPDGAALLFLQQRQRTLVLRYADQIEGVVGESVELATVIGGALVGYEIDPDTEQKVPVYLTTLEDGYAVQSEGGVPVVDFTSNPIAQDPFGENGGTPGFPLPDGFLKLIDATVVHQNGRTGPLTIVGERTRLTATRRDPLAFINGNRLVPARDPSVAPSQARDIWSTITAVGLSYIALPVADALSDDVVIPDVLAEPLVAGLAELMATSSRSVPASEKRDFAAAARTAEAMLDTLSDQLLESVTTRGVVYRG